MRIQDWETLAGQARFQPSTMAALCPISLRHLRRFFKEAFDRTPSEWLRDVRCKRAMRLVSEGWSTKAIAVELHYADESSFCHEFKRVYGFPPQTYAPMYCLSKREAGLAAADVPFRQSCPF